MKCMSKELLGILPPGIREIMKRAEPEQISQIRLKCGCPVQLQEGGADRYLEELLDQILKEALARTDGEPEYLGLAGYSLAGLFAIYAMYRTDRFSRVCSMSGSLWFPDFREFALSHPLVRKPDRLYLSVGDREARSRNRMLQSVQDNTEFLADFYRKQGIETEYELNPGNHYQDAALRCAKGIAWILK